MIDVDGLWEAAGDMRFPLIVEIATGEEVRGVGGLGSDSRPCNPWSLRPIGARRGIGAYKGGASAGMAFLVCS